MVISISFEDTIVNDEYPNIGELTIDCIDVINYLHSRGHYVIIETIYGADYENKIRSFLKYHNIGFDSINKNAPRSIKKYGDNKIINCDLRISSSNFFIQSDMWANGVDAVLDNLWRIVDEVIMDLERPLIICIVGESGVGKSMVAEYFEYEYGVNLIQSYTDRQKRFDGETGHDFVSEDRMTNILLNDTLAVTVYEDRGKKYRYCSLVDDMDKVNTYVLTEDALQMLQDKWDDYFDIYSIRIHRDEDKRLEYAGKERCDRDKGRYTMKDSEFDWVIQNRIDDKEVVYEQVREFVEKFRFKNRFEDYELIVED